MKPIAPLKWGTVILMTMVIVGGLTTTSGVWAQAGTWPAATNGSDVTGNGSGTKPFATIQHVSDVAAPTKLNGFTLTRGYASGAAQPSNPRPNPAGSNPGMGGVRTSVWHFDPARL